MNMQDLCSELQINLTNEGCRDWSIHGYAIGQLVDVCVHLPVSIRHMLEGLFHLHLQPWMLLSGSLLTSEQQRWFPLESDLCSWLKRRMTSQLMLLAGTLNTTFPHSWQANTQLCNVHFHLKTTYRRSFQAKHTNTNRLPIKQSNFQPITWVKQKSKLIWTHCWTALLFGCLLHHSVPCLLVDADS